MTVYRLDPWPVSWSQLNDPAMDGDATGPNNSGDNAYNDCGPESVSEVIMYVCGVNIDADYIKDTMYGKDYVGYTDFAHLAAYLNNHADIPTGLLSAQPAELFDHCSAWVQAGHPSIALMYFNAINCVGMNGPQTGGHFVSFFGFDDARNAIISDPYGWGERTLTPQQWNWCSQGVALACNRKRSIVY